MHNTYKSGHDEKRIGPQEFEKNGQVSRKDRPAGKKKVYYISECTGKLKGQRRERGKSKVGGGAGKNITREKKGGKSET